VEKIREAHANDETVYNVSVASNGDWFFSTSAFNTKKTFNDVSESRVTKFCNLANINVGNIRWITFMPGREGFIGVCVIDGVEQCFYQGIPQSLETHLSSEPEDLQSVSVGHNNSWIVVHQNGSINWNGIPEALANKLKAGYSSSVESVVLSPVSAEFIINYESGASCYLLPPAWGPAIARQEALLQELTQAVNMNTAQLNLQAATMFSASVAAGIAAQSAAIF
jgi:hypothetical protein